MTATPPIAEVESPTAGHPPHVELLIAFTNSVDRELETDELTTRQALTHWLLSHGLLAHRVLSTDEDLAIAVALRHALHAAMVGNHDGVADGAALERAAAALPLQLCFPTTQPGLRPVHEGVRGALSLVLIAVHSAVADDTWRRLKVCAAADCAWAYFDTTKNRSRAWCEWGCGNRNKTRNYRARRKMAASSTS